MSGAAEPPAFYLEEPAAEARLDPLGFRVRGWIHDPRRSAPLREVEVHAGARCIGRTRVILPRTDVAARFGPTARGSGFSLFGHAPHALGRAESHLQLVARWEDDIPTVITTVPVQWILHDYRREDYGGLLHQERLAHRTDIYGTGPSAPQADPQCCGMVLARLGDAPRQVLDVGCGIGAYAGPLRAAGHEWYGVEVKASDCAELRRRQLPHRQIEPGPLPFPARSFDVVIAIEVLEHIPDPVAFVQELRRVARHRVVLSVPNAELIPYLRPHFVVPWHLLEGDHKNFFTRASLHHLLAPHFSSVEIEPYGELAVRAQEGFRLYYHLLATADV